MNSRPNPLLPSLPFLMAIAASSPPLPQLPRVSSAGKLYLKTIHHFSPDHGPRLSVWWGGRFAWRTPPQAPVPIRSPCRGLITIQLTFELSNFSTPHRGLASVLAGFAHNPTSFSSPPCIVACHYTTQAKTTLWHLFPSHPSSLAHDDQQRTCEKSIA